jgi:hypothetical protein
MFSCWDISKIASKDSYSGLQMNFFRESEKFWTKLALTPGKQFSGSESIDCTDALHCSKWKVYEMK